MSIGYVAGTIETSIENSVRFECGDCFDLFTDNDKMLGNVALDNGRKPCQSTFDICFTTHKYVQCMARDAAYSFQQAKQDILHEIDNYVAYPNTNFEGHEEHKQYFIEFVVEKYVEIQATYPAKKITLNEQKMLLRNKYMKALHFMGQ